MGIFVTLFFIGLVLAIIMIGLSFMGDFDLFGDIDVDLDTDVDVDVDLDVDLDTDIDIDGDVDVDGDVDGGAEHYAGFSFLSPYMISFLFMGVGMGGTFLEDSYNFDEPVLYTGAFAIGLVIMVVMQKVFRAFFVNTQVNSLVKNKDFAGAIGVVSLRIPEGDIGEVAVSTRSGTIKMAARADQFLPLGTKVVVKEKLGTFLMVKAVGEVKVPKKIESKDTERDDKKGAGTGTDVAEKKKEEESEFTFEAYKKKEEAKKPTVIYDQRNITIKDSVINRSDFGEVGGEKGEEKPPSVLKKEMKKKLAEEIITDGKNDM